MVLTGEELGKLLRKAVEMEPDYYGFILLLADTGAHIGEATALRWADVDLERGTIRSLVATPAAVTSARRSLMKSSNFSKASLFCSVIFWRVPRSGRC